MGTVRGGAYDTATAAECLLKGSVYFGPDCGSVASVMDAIRTVVLRHAQADSWLRATPPAVRFYHHDDASRVTPDTPIAANVAGAWATVAGAPCRVRPFGGACDMRHLVNQGDIPTVIFGPGSGEQAHRPDEYVALRQLVPCIQTLALAIYRWCGA